ncbi:MAG: hypothetical protein VX874_15835 [Pseudomonadota bacterium]|nr:hypothetical protein [Pseudomonadota bacterium]
MMAARIDTVHRSAETIARPVRPARGRVIEAAIWDLVVWAFRAECVRLDFDIAPRPSNVGVEWRMMQQARLGCRVDGGGYTAPHPDADVIAATVATLPEAFGGRGMAVAIAEAARLGKLPDPMVGAVPMPRPAALCGSRYGAVARTQDAADLGAQGWPRQVRVNRRGNRVEEAVLFVPIDWWPRPEHIGAARRDWLRFWSALAEVRDNLRIGGGLSCFSVTTAMPPQTPWKTGE